MTQEQYDAWAERIAAVLCQRRKIGEERRQQERERACRNSDRALARYHRLRGEGDPRPTRGSRELDNLFEVIITSNAAAGEHARALL